MQDGGQQTAWLTSGMIDVAAASNAYDQLMTEREVETRSTYSLV